MGYTHTLVEHVKMVGMAMNDPEGFQREIERKYGKDRANKGAEKLITGIAE
jgi:hypothetical protein